MKRASASRGGGSTAFGRGGGDVSPRNSSVGYAVVDLGTLHVAGLQEKAKALQGCKIAVSDF